jgi:hypothetical protein
MKKQCVNPFCAVKNSLFDVTTICCPVCNEALQPLQTLHIIPPQPISPSVISPSSIELDCRLSKAQEAAAKLNSQLSPDTAAMFTAIEDASKSEFGEDNDIVGYNKRKKEIAGQQLAYLAGNAANRSSEAEVNRKDRRSKCKALEDIIEQLNSVPVTPELQQEIHTLSDLYQSFLVEELTHQEQRVYIPRDGQERKQILNVRKEKLIVWLNKLALPLHSFSVQLQGKLIEELQSINRSLLTDVLAEEAEEAEVSLLLTSPLHLRSPVCAEFYPSHSPSPLEYPPSQFSASRAAAGGPPPLPPLPAAAASWSGSSTPYPGYRQMPPDFFDDD